MFHRRAATSGLLAAILAIGVPAWAAPGPQPSPQPSPEEGRWITESGNLEVEVAPCGQYHCGTIVRVIANKAMGGPGASAGAAAALVGNHLLFNLRALDGGGWQGRIHNRGDGKTYHSRLQALSPERLQLTIYAERPDDGVVQVWRRPEAP